MALDAEHGTDSDMLRVHLLLVPLVVMLSVSPFASQTDSSTRNILLEAGNLTSTPSLPTVNGSTTIYSTLQTLNRTEVSNSSESTNSDFGNLTTILPTLTAESGDGTQSTQWTSASVDGETHSNSSNLAANTTEGNNLTVLSSLTENNSTSTSPAPLSTLISALSRNELNTTTNTKSTVITPEAPSDIQNEANNNSLSTSLSTLTSGQTTFETNPTVSVLDSPDGPNTTVSQPLPTENDPASSLSYTTSPSINSQSIVQTKPTVSATSGQSSVETNSTILGPNFPGWLNETASPHAASENISTSLSTSFSTYTASQATVDTNLTVLEDKVSTSPSISTNNDSNQQLTTNKLVSNSNSSMSNMSLTSPVQGYNSTTHEWISANTSDSTSPIPEYNASTPEWISTNNSDLTSSLLEYNASTPDWISTNNSDLTSSVPEYNASTPEWISANTSDSTPPIHEYNASTPKWISANTSDLTSSVPEYNASTPEWISTNTSDLTSSVPEYNVSTPEWISANTSDLTSSVLEYNASTPDWISTNTSDLTSSVPEYNVSTPEWISANTSDLTSSVPEYNASTPEWISANTSDSTSPIHEYNASTPEWISANTSDSTSPIHEYNASTPEWISANTSDSTSSIPEYNASTPDWVSTNNSDLTSSVPEYNASNPVWISTNNSDLTSSVPEYNASTPEWISANNSDLTSLVPEYNASTPEWISANTSDLTSSVPEYNASTPTDRTTPIPEYNVSTPNWMSTNNSSFTSPINESTSELLSTDANNSQQNATLNTSTSSPDAETSGSPPNSIVPSQVTVYNSSSTVSTQSSVSTQHGMLTNTVDNNTQESTTELATTVTNTTVDVSSSLQYLSSTVQGDNASTSVSTAAARTINVTAPPSQLERSFEGELRIVSFRGADAVYDPSLEDPNSSLYKQLKDSFEKFVDRIYQMSQLTRSDYIGSTVRRFRNGSVVADFGSVFRPASTVIANDLETLMTTVLDATAGTSPGTDIKVDPTVITFQPTNECELGIDDCSMYAVCEDLGADGYTCHCQQGTIDVADKPGRLCLYPNTTDAQPTGSTVVTSWSTLNGPTDPRSTTVDTLDITSGTTNVHSTTSETYDNTSSTTDVNSNSTEKYDNTSMTMNAPSSTTDKYDNTSSATNAPSTTADRFDNTSSTTNAPSTTADRFDNTSSTTNAPSTTADRFDNTSIATNAPSTTADRFDNTSSTANAPSTTADRFDNTSSTTNAPSTTADRFDNTSSTTNAPSTTADRFDNTSNTTNAPSTTADRFDNTSRTTNAPSTTADRFDNTSSTTNAPFTTADNTSSEMSTVAGIITINVTAPISQFQERSFEGVLRIVSFRGADAVFNSSLEDPESSFYKQLKGSVENLIDSIYNRSSLTKEDYLGSIVRSFSNGSVVVNFGALLRPTSTVTADDLQSTTVMETTNGTVPGTDITVDPTATTFKPTTNVTQPTRSTPAPLTSSNVTFDNEVSTVPTGPASNVTAHPSQLQERSFEGVLRIVSFRDADAAYNSSLEDPDSPFYQQLKESVEKLVDSIFRLSRTTKNDYLGSTVRRYSNGSVVVNFGALFRPASAVTAGHLESLAATVLKATGGTFPGTDITVEPAVITFTPTDECELGIDDCSMYAVCEDLGADGFSCQCQPGTIDAEAGTRPGRLCLYPTTAGTQDTVSSPPTAESSVTMATSQSSTSMTTKATTEEEEEGEDDPPSWAGWQIGIFVLGITIGILILAAVFHRLANLRNHFRHTEDRERRNEQARAERAAYRDRSWSFMYRRPEAEGTPDQDEYTDGGLGGDLLNADGQTVTPSAPPMENEGEHMNETGVQTDPVPGDNLPHRVGGDGTDGQTEETDAHGQAASTTKESEDSTSVTVEDDEDQEKAKDEAESTSDGCVVM
ncbi:serine-rich adhesin for platelets-like [Patiria miniata]|uniref:Uncharacterized protein n=1 Tax=Patiria miniata TaxID=46514 RepID=A0A914BIF0_PATMI|nr:serine-rich adhesin for platelets-like [Patiria miniata]